VKSRVNWIRACEHSVLRVLSVIFSAVSAHAILWFYSSMDKVMDTSDPLQPVVKWGLAIGFTALGYFVSRGLVHRMLNREPIKVYMVICFLLELVEFSANFSQAAVSIHSVDWLHLFTGTLYAVLQAMVYLVMPITPLFTLALAVVDMDLDRAKQGYVVRGFGTTPVASAPSVFNGLAKAMPGRAGSVAMAQPKQAPHAVGNPPTMAIPPTPTYHQGYPGASAPSSPLSQQPRNWLGNWLGGVGRGAQPAASQAQAPVPKP